MSNGEFSENKALVLLAQFIVIVGHEGTASLPRVREKSLHLVDISTPEECPAAAVATTSSPT
jgi:hypothetical protein